jgi:hypothetical protein
MKKYVKVVIPSKVDEVLTLCNLVLAKHTADGAASLLSGLNMTDFGAKTAFASMRHTNAQQLARDREMATQERNNALGIKTGMQSYNEGSVLYFLTAIRNHLLGQFRSKEQTLGVWGFDVNINAKGAVSVVISRSPGRLMELAQRVLNKHVADDEDTLLGGFDMEDFADKLAYAKEQHELSQEHFREMKRAYSDRNLALGFDRRQRLRLPETALYYLTSVRDVLLGNFRNNEHQLGLWGFTVVASTPTNPDPEPITAMVQGMVTNASTGMPIGGVTLVFASSAGDTLFTSNPAGFYEGEVELDAPETVMVEIAHAGYQPMSEAHTLSPDLVYAINFALTPVITP